MNVVAVPIIESNTELQGTRHSSMTARNVGVTTDRNSLSARQANGAAMLVENNLSSRFAQTTIRRPVMHVEW